MSDQVTRPILHVLNLNGLLVLILIRVSGQYLSAALSSGLFGLGYVTIGIFSSTRDEMKTNWQSRLAAYPPEHSPVNTLWCIPSRARALPSLFYYLMVQSLINSTRIKTNAKKVDQLRYAQYKSNLISNRVESSTENFLKKISWINKHLQSPPLTQKTRPIRAAAYRLLNLTIKSHFQLVQEEITFIKLLCVYGTATIV